MFVKSLTSKTKLFLWIAMLALVGLACGTLNIGVVETPEEIPASTTDVLTQVSGGATLTATPIQPTEEPDFSHLWVEYRDPAYGYGVALPAHWLVNPTPNEGYDGVMTAHSYDEAYFMAHSTKGWWTDGVIPEGVIKMDFAGLADEHPDLDLATSIIETYSQAEMTVVLSTEAVTYNGTQAILMRTASPNSLDEVYTSIAFRLSNEKILLVTAFWGDAFNSQDVQAILNSFVYEGEAVTLPKIAPYPPLSENSVSPDSSSMAAVAWVGHILGMPEGSQFDDFVLLSPPGSGEFGITGSTPEIESEIRFLRDADGVDEYVHLWGQFSCSVEDYNNCRLLVDRIQRGATYTEENADGWMGTIIGSTFNGGSSHIFQLAGDVPMWYSIHASQDAAMQAEIESLRDTGAIVQVWGTLMVGVPEMNGTRIEPARLEVIEPGSDRPSSFQSAAVAPGWHVYTNARFGYRIHYPESAQIVEHGPDGGIPSEEIPEGMSVDLYQEQLQAIYPKLCVEIRFDQGYINISAPPNAEARYSPCGPTGVGSGEVIPKTEEVYFGNQLYIAKGMEFFGDASTLSSDLEMMSFSLEDGTRIRYGGGSTSTTSYDDYKTRTKEILLSIMATYQPMVNRVYPFEGGEPGSISGSVVCESGFFGTVDEMVEVITYNLEIGNYYPFTYSMGNPFVIGYWRSEGVLMDRAEALTMLQNGIFPAPGIATFTQDAAKFPTLDGTPLASIWGPDVDIAANLYSTGWGPAGLGEAILTIARCANGTFYWHGMLYAQNGFE